ncbi:unnamed protein product [Anisakis simplex]|uniref:Glyco_trans_2-like domain-containing protein n=1 Tax=Anisakis simplex TaxID=6269 RepID=A0A0M3KHU3_ANISI|nr:unnamed protein product [Anisakis simplex]
MDGIHPVSGSYKSWSSRRVLPKDRQNVTVSIVVVASGREGDFLSQVPTIKVKSKSHKSDRLTNYAEKIKKESDDYWNCLRYVLLIEDDAIPVPHFMPLLNSVVQQMDSNPQIDFVKLYHPRYLRKIPYYFQVIISLVLSRIYHK